MNALLTSAKEVAARTSDIAPNSLLALDTEFYAEHRYAPRLLLVQVRTEAGQTLIIDPLEPDALEAATPALLRARWIVHSGRQDLRLMHQALGGLPDEVFDTQIGAGLRETLFPSRYEDLLTRFLGRASPPSATLSKWSQRPLTQQQLDYAAADVEHLHALWRSVVACESDRRDFILEACSEARQEALRDKPESWREFEIADLLSPLEARVLEDLIAWREEVARAIDQRPRSIAHNGVLVRLARIRPTTLEKISADRRFPRGLLRQRGGEIVEVVRRSLEKPPELAPATVARGARSSRLLQYLRCVVESVASSRSFASRLVCPEARLQRIAAAPPSDRDQLTHLLGGWRDHLIGDDIWSALSGRIALRWDGDLGLHRDAD